MIYERYMRSIRTNLGGFPVPLEPLTAFCTVGVLQRIEELSVFQIDKINQINWIIEFVAVVHISKEASVWSWPYICDESNEFIEGLRASKLVLVRFVFTCILLRIPMQWSVFCVKKLCANAPKTYRISLWANNKLLYRLWEP